jgi:hypothetical protein
MKTSQETCLAEHRRLHILWALALRRMMSALSTVEALE